ncbi:hypothetical protein, partial [Thermaurantiacus sp.]
AHEPQHHGEPREEAQPDGHIAEIAARELGALHQHQLPQPQERPDQQPPGQPFRPRELAGEEAIERADQSLPW